MLNWKYAVLWAVILWVLIFIVISVIIFAPPLQGNQTGQTAIELIAIPILTLLAGFMYFKDRKAGAKEGFVLAILFLVIGTVLDLIITIPLFVKTYDFFLHWNIWAGYIEVIIFSMLMGYYIGKKTGKKVT